MGRTRGLKKNLVQKLAHPFLKKSFPRHEGTIGNLPLEKPAEVLRDKWGIPYIYAESVHDLFAAQGFVHAQDRLWQMETLRRLTSGRLSELSGEATVELDFFARMVGFPEIKKRALTALTTEERGLIEAYTAGVNACIEHMADTPPFEYRMIKHVPEPWRLEDTFSFLALTMWTEQTNFREELLALRASGKVDLDIWNQLLPPYPEEAYPEEDFFARSQGGISAPLHPAAVALFSGLTIRGEGEGSNNWVYAQGPGGKPIIANDPHMVLSVPSIWYFCRLEYPGKQAAGASWAGMPGVVVGHNGSIAWGVTTAMVDYADIYTFEVDPKNPTRYRNGDRMVQMEEQTLSIGLPKGNSKEMKLYRTVHGPVITNCTAGSEYAAALKWHGTMDPSALELTDARGFLGAFTCGSVDEFFSLVENIKGLSLNLVVGDTDGNIGWHVTGSPPKRKGYSGRLPADGSSGTAGWHGYVPYGELPHRKNPPEGWIATANHRTTGGEFPHPISYSWLSAYRYNRIARRLAKLTDVGIDDCAALQMDVHSLQADTVVPAVTSYRFNDRRAEEAAEYLRGWDREVRADSPGAAVYEVFVIELIHLLVEPFLGEDIPFYFNAFLSRYTVEDIILGKPDSLLWQKGAENLGLRRGSGVEAVLEAALVRTIRFLEREMGKNRGGWSWGRIHTCEFLHPGSRGTGFMMKTASKLLNRGPFPAPGDNATVNLGGFSAIGRSYRTVAAPSMRLIVPLADPDETRIIGPLGQSGHPNHPNYDDMVRSWLQGDTLRFPFSRKEVEKAAVKRLDLVVNGTT